MSFSTAAIYVIESLIYSREADNVVILPFNREDKTFISIWHEPMECYSVMHLEYVDDSVEILFHKQCYTLKDTEQLVMSLELS